MHVRGSWGFGMARSHAVGAAQARLKELCAIASEATGTVFYPYLALTYRDLADALEKQDLGIAWMPPIPAIELEDKGAAAPLVLPARRDTTSYHAAFIMRRGQARGIAEMQGLRVAWVDKESAAGYLVPRIHLASLGFDAKRFFSQETFVQSHFGVVEAVVAGRADVGATFCSIDPRSQRIVTAGWTDPEGASLRPVDVVTTMGPIPNDAIVASAKVPAAVKAAVTRWLLHIDPQGRALLTELFHVQTFRVAQAPHYASLRHMLRAARARGFDELGRDPR